MKIGPIEKDVPLGLKGQTRNALEEMKQGDSRVFHGLKRSALYMAASRSGIVVRIREEGTGLRVWRRTK